MTREELVALFEKHSDDEYIEFTRLPKDLRVSSRKDLCGFILLDKLVPGKFEIVSSAEHDKIWLGVEIDDLAGVATEEDVKNLLRCGVRMDSSVESLAMFI